MRTTVEFDQDTARAVEAWRRERGSGVSEAVNELIRRGLCVVDQHPRFEPISRDMGLVIDVSNVADALDVLDGSDAR